MFRTGLAALAGIALCTLALSPLSAQQSKLRIIQTNFAGDTIHIIDPATNKVVLEVKDIEVPHGVAFSTDGTRAYITCEAENTLWSTDTKSGKLLGKAPLSGHPNNVAISNDGSRLFVAIRAAPGAVDVIDAKSLKNIRSIPVKGAVHNTYVTGQVVLVVTVSPAGVSSVTDAKPARM